jgi:hypothetical protein
MVMMRRMVGAFSALVELQDNRKASLMVMD